jgi:hypothetical protein
MERFKIQKNMRTVERKSVHDDTTMLDSTPENMYHLMNKINELVDEVINLRKEVERLDKVKERKTVTMGGGNWK